jgi:hypothetical protein
MALTVKAAFEEFRKDTIDLDSDETETARKSRDFLLEQIFKLPEENAGFPWLTDRRLFFGSFARKTKIQPLDDIDLMIVMHGGGGYEQQVPWDRYQCRVDPGSMESPVRYLTDDDGCISSNRVLFKFRDVLADVPHYEKAELHKSGEAVTLKLRSYLWNFDIVPTFGVTDGQNPCVYFLIPDGKGNWKRTDPRRDDERVTKVNQKHDGLVLPIIRMLKYWNRRSQCPTMMSYWLETIALSVFEESEPVQLLQLGILSFFVSAMSKVQGSCPDPKGLGPDLDKEVDAETRQKIVAALEKAAQSSLSGLKYELEEKDHKLAISEWRKVFRVAFPPYA